ncbi:hypothetical protein EDC94DRAFT_641369 [Helicostylum pulchrum]|nr:hypothetical protein EDC94DRAFT_641369 [Helicostylum pulchrum]
MSNDEIKQNINNSAVRRENLVREFVAYEYELEADKQVKTMRKKVEEIREVAKVCHERDNVNLEGLDGSVGSLIKTKAIDLYRNYHSLSINGKAIVALGLNSTIDLSFDHPQSQSTLFDNTQWRTLRSIYKSKRYVYEEYDSIFSILNPVFQCYNEKKPFEINWMTAYKKVKDLEKKYDHVLDASCSDVSFCVFLVFQMLMLMKYQPALFKEEIDCSEWDYVVKFWGVITERLFHDSGLRLKWGDTHITLHDTIAGGNLKVDLRIINDNMVQRYNTENDVSVMEAAEECPSDAKFISDRFKLSIENKTIIDRFLLNGVKIYSVDSLQISGLEIFFVNTYLAENGLYVTNEFKRFKVDNNIKNIENFINLASSLLCFRDECVSISNRYNEHLIKVKNENKSSKRPVNEVDDDELTLKQESIRGTWFPPRTARTPPPEIPKDLWK